MSVRCQLLWFISVSEGCPAPQKFIKLPREDSTSGFITTKKSKCKAVIPIGFKKQLLISFNTWNNFSKLSRTDQM